MIRNITAVLILAFCVFLSIKALGQRRPADREDRDNRSAQGTSAGGNWMQYRSEDPMTTEKHVRFVLPANNEPNSEESASIILYCTDGKLKLADSSS